MVTLRLRLLNIMCVFRGGVLKVCQGSQVEICELGRPNCNGFVCGSSPLSGAVRPRGRAIYECADKRVLKLKGCMKKVYELTDNTQM